MNVQEFVQKWSKIQQKESSTAQTHFNDLCRLAGHLPPLEADPAGQEFSFEARAIKPDGRKGFADVFYRGKFIMEYKGLHKDLKKAYQQLLLYREELHNPPLLITCDLQTIIIHTNFVNRPTEQHTITFDSLLKGDGLALLKRAFHDPQSFKPHLTQQAITQANANTFVAVADAMKQHQKLTEESYTAEQLAHFMVRLLFCLFAEDLGLLGDNIFSQMVQQHKQKGTNFQRGLQNLFREMRTGGTFGFYDIKHFNGTLFDDTFVPAIPKELGDALLEATRQNWTAIDPAIFGTLFERVIDEQKRAQLGAHYTSREDIALIVQPVLMQPLRERWRALRLRCVSQLGAQTDPATIQQQLTDFAQEIAQTRVLDPACGSGNFLYVALYNLLDLQKEVIVFAERHGLPTIPLTVSPQQLYGIEINVYAHELAQITAWIGYLQWRFANGFEELEEPILRSLHNIQRMDAIVAYDAEGNPTEPIWPLADVIIGNPPFLGGKKLRAELGDAYVALLHQLYIDRLPKEADLVCYWFEKARDLLSQKQLQRAGLLSTNSIRGGANREVLKRIKKTGDIFMAWSDNPWLLEGAAVRVSMIGFDDGSQSKRTLDGKKVAQINADLTASVDITGAHRLDENKDIAFMGDTKQGPFDIDEQTAKDLLTRINSDGRSNTDVVRPWYNGLDVVRRPRNMWIIDFGVDMTLEEAQKYEAPFAYVEKHVKPMREKNKRSWYRDEWWLHYAPRPAFREATSQQEKYIATARLAKHRLFVFLDKAILPDSQIIAFAREDDYFFGVLHSRVHEVWSLSMGTWLGKGNDPRYTPTTTFETFPFPWVPNQEPADDPRLQAIAQAAHQLHLWREAWLNPSPPTDGVINTAYQKRLKKRTLTNLYNGLQYYRETNGNGSGLFDSAQLHKLTRGTISRSEVQHLNDLHTLLDYAVLGAYGWEHDLADEEILAQLLQLNEQRAL